MKFQRPHGWTTEHILLIACHIMFLNMLMHACVQQGAKWSVMVSIHTYIHYAPKSSPYFWSSLWSQKTSITASCLGCLSDLQNPNTIIIKRNHMHLTTYNLQCTYIRACMYWEDCLGKCAQCLGKYVCFCLPPLSDLRWICIFSGCGFYICNTLAAWTAKLFGSKKTWLRIMSFKSE